ncbi:coiled-coil domain-containing protein [Neobacillus jeddahensis]|uniref:hypothetical protein n=1 Tax=Neobacillus jeddahensis TaxID=1461580 RepID=UPI00058ACCFF|nr:hypothetical protein [Neobacillus jeddahensis]
MPSISKIRLTNVIYEEGNKRYNDELFMFDGHNGAILLENGGGKTVLIQTAMQAILPHVDLADRKIKNTLLLENAPAHIAIEWISNDQPRRYVVTAVSLFMTKQGLDSLRYVYEYDGNDPNGIEGIPFVRKGKDRNRTAERGEMQDYYSHMRERSFLARTFPTIKEYKSFIEEQYHIISSEWDSIVQINSSEGGAEAFFDHCKSTNQLFDRLLIPTVESSIVGHNSNMFAEMFEQQHASLKNYKKLKETIEENQKIQVQLADYVSTYEQLHTQEIAYLKIKERTKGVWLETRQQREKYLSEQTETEKKVEEWKSSHQLHRIEAASYDILVEETEWKRLKEEYKTALSEQLEQEEKLAQVQMDFYSFKHAKLKAEQKDQQDQLAHFKAELAKLEQTEELADLQDQLEEMSAALLGYFLEEIEKLEKQQQAIRYQVIPLLGEIARVKADQSVLNSKERTVRDSLSECKAVITSRLKDMDGLKQRLLANPVQDHVKDELKQWNIRHQFLDEDIIRIGQEEKQLLSDEIEATVRLEAYRRDALVVQSAYDKATFQLEEVALAQERLIQQLASLRPQWASVESVYLKQESIEKRLIEQLEQLQSAKNTLLYRERIAYRFVDDYSTQDVFFADPFLEQQLNSWKNQFDYLVTGVEYLQTSEETIGHEYPFWPVTLITTSKSKPLLVEKLNHLSDRLQFPIVVLSSEEVLTIQEGNDAPSWVTPHHWEHNREESRFLEWKQEMVEHANESRSLREKKENEMTTWQAVLKEFIQFLEVHPFEKKATLEEDQSKASNQLADLAINMKRETDLLQALRDKISQGQTTIKTYRDEKQGLETKIEKGFQYLQFEKEVEAAGNQQKAAEREREQIEKELSQMAARLTGLEEEAMDLEKQIQGLAARVAMVKEDDEFQLLQTLSPIYSGESKQTIKGKIRDLELKIKQITTTQGEWLAKRDAAQKNIQTLSEQMKELLLEHGPLDDSRAFPSDGEQQLQRLKEKIISLKEVHSKQVEEVSKKATWKDKQAGKWETKLEQFKQAFPHEERKTFDIPLDRVAAKLAEEEQQLQDRKTFIDQELSRIAKELKQVDEGERWLEKFIEAHHFDAPDVVAQALIPEELVDFTYHRMKFLKSFTDELIKEKEALELQRQQVGRAKSVFRAFCDRSISDVKMRNMALNGIEHKTTYYDILEFKKNMMLSVERATSYANEHIRQKDAELQAFINQIHSHLLTLVEELRQIPKKTKVKIVDDWKQVFTFAIPEWDDEEGKMRIRDYLEWMLEQLESDRFLNEQGIQDDGKVRKEIETWLQSKQLLQIVMNNEVMKVSCRKVTNDNKVTTRSYSWEQSNIWSGGEKWSKNMTLFLGILNYVAEKKQHIQQNAKRHRAVILDNPFGKASSDHVLSPVFFVAEQLGFQIIALTAHAEGKFLQDYFPVIYSCRLRASTDVAKKVMTKEKWLHHAYFQDHEPKTTDRLGQTEQLAWFE